MLTFIMCYMRFFFFFSSRRRHTRSLCDWSSDVCSSDLIFDGNYSAIAACDDGFVDKDLPANYAPFNIFAANDLLFVSYALQEIPDKEDDAKGVGHGFVDLYDTTGHLLERLASREHLNSPWGMAIAPSDFGQIPNRLLVGNFGDGLINVFRLSLGGLRLRADFEGFIGDDTG